MEFGDHRSPVDDAVAKECDLASIYMWTGDE